MKSLFLGLLISGIAFSAQARGRNITDLGIVKSICNHIYSNTSGGGPGYQCFNKGIESLLKDEKLDQTIFNICTHIYSNTSGGGPGYQCFNKGISYLENSHYRMLKKTCNRVYSNTSGSEGGFLCFSESFKDLLRY